MNQKKSPGGLPLPVDFASISNLRIPGLSADRRTAKRHRRPDVQGPPSRAVR